MTLDIGQMLMVGFTGCEAPDYLLEWLRAGRIGGVILFARNIASPAQVAELTSSLHEAAQKPILIGIDQEGGTVARLRAGFTESPGALALAASGDAARVERISGVLGAELRALGINWNYAPALDILYNLDNPSLLTRSFGTDAARVGEFGAAAVRGFQNAGVAACAKHFPGLGDTAVDTHLALPVLKTSPETLLTTDLVPYRAAMAAGLASVMTTHTIYSALDPDYPATLSPVIVRKLLREALSFEGVVTTDCMEMKAISSHYGTGESTVLAALAGVDIILFSHTRAMQEAAYEALAVALQSGRLAQTMVDASVERIQRLKLRYAVHDKPDLSVIRRAEHLAQAQAAARAGVVLISGSLPIDMPGHTVLVEFASALESGVVESGGFAGLGNLIHTRSPYITIFALKGSGETEIESLLDLLRGVDKLILVTRSAHLQPAQLEQARALLSAAKEAALICLRSPLDAQILNGAEAVLCTCGDSTPSLEAAVDALLGVFTPTGSLPVLVN